MNASLLYFSREEGVSFLLLQKKRPRNLGGKKIFADRSPINGGGISTHPLRSMEYAQ